MPDSPPTKRTPQCPVCHADLAKGIKKCPECGMEVAKMKEYILAMQHAKKRAQQGGTSTAAPLTAVYKVTPFGETEQETDDERARREKNTRRLRAGLWALAAIIFMALGLWIYQKATAPSEPWRKYPTDPRVLLTEFFKIIHTDTLKEHDKAYDMISYLRKDLKDSKQRDAYMQLFHDVHKYYSTLFGDNWINEIRFEPDNGNADTATTWIGTIRTEKVTIDIEQQTPADKLKLGDPQRWGVVALREFPLGNSDRSRQINGIEGMLKGLGAEGSARQIQGIAGYGADLSRMSPTEIKQMLLPIISNPRATALTQNIYRTWVVRKDPTVRDVLQQITQDMRYGDVDRTAAQLVLTDKVPEEELIAVGVTNTDR